MIALRLDSVKLVAVFPSRVGIGFGQFVLVCLKVSILYGVSFVLSLKGAVLGMQGLGFRVLCGFGLS